MFILEIKLKSLWTVESRKMMNKRDVGKQYETLAREYLSRLNYEFVAQNVYTPYGEIDLIVNRDKTLYFVEIKYRGSTSYGTPRDAITPTKLRHMKASALYYIKSMNGYQSFNLAFVGIVKTDHHFEFDFIENILS